MATSLDRFHSAVAEDLQRVDQEMRRVLSSDVKLVANVVRYLVRRKGKSLRPTLTLLTARLFGRPNEQAIKIAVIVELLHTATLVHDDVVDESPERRGFPSINAIWKNKVSVLVGDYLLAKALTEMLNLRNFTVLDIFSATARRMSRGELLQIAKARKLDITEEVYFDMISDKTAALFSACCELAAVTAGKNGMERESLRDFGEKLGLAFQIRDDILDFSGKNILIGKPVMGDVKERKITLPLIYAMKNAKKPEGRGILKLIERGVKTHDRGKLLAFLQENNGIESAQRAAEDLRDEALARLAHFPQTESRRILEEFACFSVSRSK